MLDPKRPEAAPATDAAPAADPAPAPNPAPSPPVTSATPEAAATPAPAANVASKPAVAKKPARIAPIAKKIPPTMTDLPDELLLMVFAHLDMFSLIASCSTVARRWYRLVLTNSLSLELTSVTAALTDGCLRWIRDQTAQHATHLDLLDYVHVSGAGLASVLPSMTALRSLHLDLHDLAMVLPGGDKTDGGWTTLTLLNELRDMQLDTADVTAVAMSCISKLTNLTSLRLNDCRVRKADMLPPLANLPRLVDLVLHVRPDDFCQVDLFHAPVKLTSLTVDLRKIPPASVILTKLPCLITLTFLNRWYSYARHSSIQPLTTLQRLDLQSSAYQEGDGTLLRSVSSRMTSLKLGLLHGSGEDADFWRAVAGCQNVVELTVAQVPLTATVLDALALLTRLTALHIIDSSIAVTQNEITPRLAPLLGSLRTLDLFPRRHDAVGFGPSLRETVTTRLESLSLYAVLLPSIVDRITHLTSLSVHACQDRNLAALGRLCNLRSLQLTYVLQDSLRWLSSLVNLTMLEVRASDIEDSCLASVLTAPQLSTLILCACHCITPSGLLTFRSFTKHDLKVIVEARPDITHKMLRDISSRCVRARFTK
eukprot:TRINITY_DN6895_c0_g1_i1.p1 TRINITY_DN6895_c0_g1~~TRINITY_DN6895_c0_g1_i1.p1  ORF type:complete len:596 (+),score=194.43 TRINITY_DN6895_c0_g1_i1:2003-3790(+)